MFRKRHAWCWNVAPTIKITGEIYDEIQLDGTYLATHPRTDAGSPLRAAARRTFVPLTPLLCRYPNVAAVLGRRRQ